MPVFILLLIGCHYVVYEIYKSVVASGAVGPQGVMGMMALAFLMGFMVAVVAMIPGRNKRNTDAELDDAIFNRTSQATLIRREPQAASDSGKNSVAGLAPQSVQTVNPSTGAVDTSRADWAIPIDKSRPR